MLKIKNWLYQIIDYLSIWFIKQAVTKYFVFAVFDTSVFHTILLLRVFYSEDRARAYAKTNPSLITDFSTSGYTILSGTSLDCYTYLKKDGLTVLKNDLSINVSIDKTLGD